MIVLVETKTLIIKVLWHCLAINIRWSPLILNNVLYILLYMYGMVLLYASSFGVWNGTSLCMEWYFFMLLYLMYGMVPLYASLLKHTSLCFFIWCKQNLVMCMCNFPLYKEEQIAYSIQIRRIYYIKNTLQGSITHYINMAALHKQEQIT